MISKESLINARETINQVVFRFRQSYNRSKNSQTIYLIVEGKDDVPYYSSVINHYLIENWKCKILVAKNRKNVVGAYLDLDWNKYPKKQILFFIDRDLSEFTDEFTPEDENVYVTENYSIENDIFNRKTFESTMQSFYGLYDADEQDVELLIKLFDDAYFKFQNYMVLIMSWILFWRKNELNCNLDNIRIDRMISINNAMFEVKPTMCAEQEIALHIHSKCEVPHNQVDLSPYTREFIEKNGKERFIRGKYIRTFFVMFVNSVHVSSSNILPSGKKTKTSIGLGCENAIPILCGIMRIPDKIDIFIKNTCLEYIHALSS